MQWFIVAANTASPHTLMVIGGVAFVVGGILALDIGGIGTRYIKITLRKNKDDLDRQQELQVVVKRYKSYFALGSVLGLVLFTSGLLQ